MLLLYGWQTLQSIDEVTPDASPRSQQRICRGEVQRFALGQAGRLSPHGKEITPVLPAGVEHVEVITVFDPPFSMEMVPEETRMMMGWF